jgi:hypothetical protein
MKTETDPERVMIWVAVALMFIGLVVLLNVGCRSADPKVVYERVEVPMPYWDPPENLKPLPPEIELQSSHLSPGEAKADPTTALILVGQDFGLCLGDLEELRHLYEELLRVCSAPVETPVPSHGPGPN